MSSLRPTRAWSGVLGLPLDEASLRPSSKLRHRGHDATLARPVLLKRVGAELVPHFCPTARETAFRRKVGAISPYEIAGGIAPCCEAGTDGRRKNFRLRRLF